MGLLGDTRTLLLREMLIYRKNLGINIARTLIFPIIFIILIGSFGSAPKNVPVALVNYDNGPLSLRFVNALQADNSMQFVSSTTQQQAMDLLARGSVAGVIVIPAGFSSYASGSQTSVYVYLDKSQPQSAAVVSNLVSGVASTVGVRAVQDPSLISVVTNYAYGAGSNYLSFVVGGIVIMVASFGAVFSSGFTMLSDRELGNMKAFLTTPINRFSILLSKIGYGTFQSAVSAYVGLAIGLIYGATFGAGVVGFIELLWIIFLVGLGFGAMSIAMATRTKQLQTYALISQTIVMPMSFLGGAFVPVSLLPSFLQPIAVVNPLTYAVNATRDIMIKGYLPLSMLVFVSAILLAFAGVMLALALAFFRDTSKQII